MNGIGILDFDGKLLARFSASSNFRSTIYTAGRTFGREAAPTADPGDSRLC